MKNKLEIFKTIKNKHIITMLRWKYFEAEVITEEDSGDTEDQDTYASSHPEVTKDQDA